MNVTAPPARPPSTWKRDLVWVIALVLAFLVGYLYALIQRPPITPPACPQSGTPAGSGGGGGGGGGKLGAGAPGGAGSPAHLGGAGDGDGQVVGGGGSMNGDGAGAKLKGGGSGDGDLPPGGAASGNGIAVASGGKGEGTAVAEEADLGGGGKGGPVPSGELPPSLPADTKTKPVDGKDAVPSATAGDGSLGDDMPDMKLAPDQPGSRIVGARDFSYDRSGLPHYPNSVDKIASAMAIPPGGAVADGNTTIAEILTNDDPDKVAAWYRAQLPQDQWQMQAPPSATDVDQGIQQSDKPAADFDKLAKDLEKTQQPGGGGQAAAMAILMKGMMAGQHGGEHGDASVQGTPIDGMFGKIANMQLRGAQEGLNRMREAHLTIFQPIDRARDPRSILILRDAKTGKTAVVISKKATRA